MGRNSEQFEQLRIWGEGVSEKMNVIRTALAQDFEAAGGTKFVAQKLGVEHSTGCDWVNGNSRHEIPLVKLVRFLALFPAVETRQALAEISGGYFVPSEEVRGGEITPAFASRLLAETGIFHAEAMENKPQRDPQGAILRLKIIARMVAGAILKLSL